MGMILAWRVAWISRCYWYYGKKSYLTSTSTAAGKAASHLPVLCQEKLHHVYWYCSRKAASHLLVLQQEKLHHIYSSSTSVPSVCSSKWNPWRENLSAWTMGNPTLPVNEVGKTAASKNPSSCCTLLFTTLWGYNGKNATMTIKWDQWIH